MSSGKWQPFCLGLNVLKKYIFAFHITIHPFKLKDKDSWNPFSLKSRTLQWCHNERDGISNYQRLDGLLNYLFRCRSKETSKLCATGLCEGNPPGTWWFPSQRASNVENVAIWWRHHDLFILHVMVDAIVAANLATMMTFWSKLQWNMDQNITFLSRNCIWTCHMAVIFSYLNVSWYM